MRSARPLPLAGEILFSGGGELYDLVITEASSLYNICEAVYVIRSSAYWTDSTFVREVYRVNINPRVRSSSQGLRVASHALVPGSDS
ncbi:MAG: hypothetical protein WCP31_04365 [Chloroflexales bacterium]